MKDIDLNKPDHNDTIENILDDTTAHLKPSDKPTLDNILTEEEITKEI